MLYILCLFKTLSHFLYFSWKSLWAQVTVYLVWIYHQNKIKQWLCMACNECVSGSAFHVTAKPENHEEKGPNPWSSNQRNLYFGVYLGLASWLSHFTLSRDFESSLCWPLKSLLCFYGRYKVFTGMWEMAVRHC